MKLRRWTKNIIEEIEKDILPTMLENEDMYQTEIEELKHIKQEFNKHMFGNRHLYNYSLQFRKALKSKVKHIENHSPCCLSYYQRIRRREAMGLEPERIEIRGKTARVYELV